MTNESAPVERDVGCGLVLKMRSASCMRARTLLTASEVAGVSGVWPAPCGGSVDETGGAVVVLLDGGFAAGSCGVMAGRGVGEGAAVLPCCGCEAMVLGRVCGDVEEGEGEVA